MFHLRIILFQDGQVAVVVLVAEIIVIPAIAVNAEEVARFIAQ